MKGARPKIAVVGSMVMDLVFRVARRPQEGETMPADSFGMFLGGKGFNQAVACRRLGAEVTIVGRVGQDVFGDMFLAKLREEGMATKYVKQDRAVGTGVAAPVVFPSGQNSIIAAPRANVHLAPEDVDAAASEIEPADMLMLQYEVNPAASRRAAEIARSSGVPILLDPAPAHAAQTGDDYFQADYLVPNEIEATMLAGDGKPTQWVRTLLPGRKALVVSLGEKGALLADQQGISTFAGFRVDVVDTTGAGDAFRAGLAVMLARGRDIDEAVRFANACGALACTVLGAEPSMPTLQAVESFLAEKGA